MKSRLPQEERTRKYRTVSEYLSSAKDVLSVNEVRGEDEQLLDARESLWTREVRGLERVHVLALFQLQPATHAQEHEQKAIHI